MQKWEKLEDKKTKKTGQINGKKGDTKYIAYYRVSTETQGQSRLGLEAQKTDVENYVMGKGGKILGEFIEIESGKKDKREELEKAISRAKEIDAVLIVAKLDRLSRNVSFVFKLRDSGVNFVCCDNPQANTLTIAIFAGIAQQEREFISQRTKAALQELKKRGVKLGHNSLTQADRIKGAKAMHDKFMTSTEQVREIIRLKRIEAGTKKLTYKEIADYLNEKGFRTIKGKLFHTMQIRRIEKGASKASK